VEKAVTPFYPLSRMQGFENPSGFAVLLRILKSDFSQVMGIEERGVAY